MTTLPKQYTAFQGEERLTTGTLEEVLTYLKTNEPQGQDECRILIFDDASGRQADFDLRGTLVEVLRRELPLPERTGPGRPKLGVVAREVTLLPRHWDWLERQRGGASATLRRLIDEARKANPEAEAQAQARAAADRFMLVMAGDQAGYEEATRALYQGNRAAFLQHTEGWPAAIRAHALQLASEGLQ